MFSCTIVIPTHNREDLLPRSVRSALAACPTDGEVLVVDDKSIVPAVDVLRDLHDQRLRVLINTGPSGAANARNLGVTSASGVVIFFLDDDDQLLPDYCNRVLAIVAENGSASQWGFSGTVERRGRAPTNDSLRVRKRLKSGLVPLSARPRDLVAAMSDGFWVRRQLFLEAGALDPEQIIDEDTDLCIRLLAASKQPWYESDPGMIVYKGYEPVLSKGAQLTLSIGTQRGLDCYRRTYDRNAESFGRYSVMRWYLATRFLRRAVKLRQVKVAQTFLRSIDSMAVRLALQAFVIAKWLVHTTRPTVE